MLLKPSHVSIRRAHHAIIVLFRSPRPLTARMSSYLSMTHARFLSSTRLEPPCYAGYLKHRSALFSFFSLPHALRPFLQPHRVSNLTIFPVLLLLIHFLDATIVAHEHTCVAGTTPPLCTEGYYIRKLALFCFSLMSWVAEATI